MSTVQVDKEHYSFGSYGFEGRFVSYFWQLREVLSHKPESVVEIGVGDKVFGNFLKENTNVNYRSVDIDEALRPDLVGKIEALPVPDKDVDIACAFEVLEHIPFNDVPQALKELARVARGYVIISVPHFGPMLSFSLKLPLLPQMRVAFKLSFPKRHVFNGQHHWELGKKGYPVRRLCALLREIGTIERDFIPFNSEYHHFFVVRLPAKQ